MATKKASVKKKEAEEVIIEEKTSEELKKEFFDSKDDKESILFRVINIVLWIVLLAWMAICFIDFYRTQKRQEPMFTFKNQTVKYDDGEVKSYLGLGYKIYNYKRKCFDGIEYGPFWSNDRSVESETCNK